MKRIDFLTTKELLTKAPSAGQTEAIGTASKKYVHINTMDIVSDMAKLGWFPVNAKEVKTRTPNKLGFQRHIIEFQNPNIYLEDSTNDNDTSFPQIILINSSDRTTPFQFKAGLFRLICENGLIIATETFGQFSFRHMGYTYDGLKENVTQLVENLPAIISKISTLRLTKLDEKEKHQFALKALGLKINTDMLIQVEDTIAELLTTNRPEDAAEDNLWLIYNTVQENLLNGNFSLSKDEDKKPRKARAIKNIAKDVQMNQELFNLALEYC